MSDLVKRLRIKAGMIEMGERIAWGSDSALMREAADALELAAQPKWRPIETAPKDGAAVLLYYGDDYYVMEGKCFPVKSSFQGRASSYKWVSAVDMGDLEPTHWMPLPNPPEERLK